MLLENKTAMVTGGASGIGRAVAMAHAREGARVIVSDVDEAGGAETVALIRQATKGATASFVMADASSPDDHERLVREAVQQYGGLHVACNNAGIAGELTPAAELSVEAWRKVIEVNLSGVFYALRAQIAQMRTVGGGAIVNMASVLGQVGTPALSAYVAAKHGVVGLTQAAALENAAGGIRINAVGPGYIDTPLLDALPDDERQGLVALHPIGRLGTAEEVAELVVWLSSDRASFVTGSYHPVDGGYLAQ